MCNGSLCEFESYPHCIYSSQYSSRTSELRVLVLWFSGLWTCIFVFTNIDHNILLWGTINCTEFSDEVVFSSIWKHYEFSQFCYYLICTDRHVVLNRHAFLLHQCNLLACSSCLLVCLPNARSGAACCAMRASHCTVIFCGVKYNSTSFINISYI